MRRPEESLVFVRRNGELLVLHRAPNRGAYWHCVAGALEPGESFAEAAARELREETGLDGSVAAVGAPYAYPLSEDPTYRDVLPPGTEAVTVASFVVDAPEGWEPVLNDEHDGYRWCAVEEAAGLLRWPDVGKLARKLTS